MGKRILIVDDDIGMRRKLRTIVTDLGNVVVGETSSPKEAIAIFVNTNPEVVLLDLLFEDYHGLRILKGFLNINKDARVIVISGVDVETIIIKTLTEGAISYLVKPIEKEQLKKELEYI